MRNVAERGWPYYSLWIKERDIKTHHGHVWLEKLWSFDGLANEDYTAEHIASLDVLGLEIVEFERKQKIVQKGTKADNG